MSINVIPPPSCTKQTNKSEAKRDIYMEVTYSHPSNLPPGFEFDPSDEELILHFLYNRTFMDNPHPNIIPDLHLSAIDPWDLRGNAFCGCNIWYFYSKLKNEGEESETKSGYWNLEDVEDEPIYSSVGNKIGFKRFYVFYIGEPPLGIQTSWIMEEYHLCPRKSSESERWVLCRVLENEDRNGGQEMDENSEVELSSLDEVFLSLEEDDAQV